MGELTEPEAERNAGGGTGSRGHGHGHGHTMLMKLKRRSLHRGDDVDEALAGAAAISEQRLNTAHTARSPGFLHPGLAAAG